MKSLPDVMIAIIVIGIITFLTRAFSFIIFNRRKPSEYILFIEEYIPPMVMVILVTYCFVAVDFTSKPFGIPHIVSALFVLIIHILLKNPLISIFGGTIIYMVLISF